MEPHQSQQALELRDYARILSRRKALLIFPFIITVLAVIAGSYFLDPIFESSTTILVAENNLLSPTFSNMVRDEERGLNHEQRQERLNTIRNQILSTAYLTQLLERLQIPVSTKTKESVTKLMRQFPDAKEAELTRKLQIERIRKTIDVNFKGSNLVEITVTAASPVMASQKAGTLADIYINESLASELVGVKGAMDFSDDMLSVYRGRLQQSEGELRQFEQGMLRSAAGTDSSVAGNLNQINSANDATDLEIQTAISTLQSLKADLAGTNTQNTHINYSNRLTTLRNEALNGIAGLSELLARYSWRDARVMRLNEQARQRLEAIESEADNLTAKQFPSYDNDTRRKIAEAEYLTIKLEFLKEKRHILYAATDNVKSLIVLNPSMRQKHEDLQRKVDEDRRVYELFSEQLTGSQISQAATRAEAGTRFKIIEPASVPVIPQSPDRVKLAGIGAILGLILGLGAILIVEILDNSFHKVEEVESYLGLKVIGTIPRMELPLSERGAGRVWIIVGTAVALILLGAVIYLERIG